MNLDATKGNIRLNQNNNLTLNLIIMKNSTFTAQVFANNELRLSLPFNFGGDYKPETKSEVVGTIVSKFLKFMELNRRYKSGLLTSKDKIDFRFTNHVGEIIGTTELTSMLGIDFKFRFNKTIEAKLEQFIYDAIDFAEIDEITEAQSI